MGSLSHPSYFKKSLQRLLYLLLYWEDVHCWELIPSCSQARLYGCCFGMLNMRRLAHPIITLSPSKPCTISQITSAESHPQETAVHQSLSYVFHILLWVTQIKSSEGTMPAQCASPKTQLFFCHDKE